jgi:hypothetical protein
MLENYRQIIKISLIIYSLKNKHFVNYKECTKSIHFKKYTCFYTSGPNSIFLFL